MYTKKQRIMALVGVILLVILYLVTLISAIFAGSYTKTLFRVSLVLTVAVPILLWIYIWLYGRLKKQDTIADLDILQTGDLSDRKNKSDYDQTKIPTED
ncbi:MAG: hypothetical protein K6G07_01495 [Lachnospiraceae bacterium]|nr:hypothetical protein [Lachnospiraceae bacterium]